MRSINKVILIGNLTRDPELRQTPNGQNVTTFGLATNREWTTKNGERNNSAEFHECVAWAHLAEICQKFLKKGNLIYVEGYLKTRNWDSPEGVKKFKTEIVVQDMIRLEKRPPGEQQQSRSEAEAQSPSPSSDEAPSSDDPTGPSVRVSPA
ncbi:MAG: single-stranded DNA-binding protein, partial [Patescibacteria group bacterium]